MSSFPQNVIDAILPSVAELMPGYEVLQRPLRHLDPDQSLGIFPADWTPNQETVQMGDQAEPAIAVYEFRIQVLIKASDEEMGRALFALACKSIRVMLYRDAALIVRLQALNETLLGTVESMKRYGVRRQRFLNNELQGRLMWLATTDFFLETESRKT